MVVKRCHLVEIRANALWTSAIKSLLKNGAAPGVWQWQCIPNISKTSYVNTMLPPLRQMLDCISSIHNKIIWWKNTVRKRAKTWEVSGDIMYVLGRMPS